MRKLFSLPLVFFVIAAGIGVFLRGHLISPWENVNYRFVLHAHSHLMFLGWVFNVLFLAYVYKHIPKLRRKVFTWLFYVLQVLVIGMMISFPLQGYGVYSIILSTLHTLAAVVFIVCFFRETGHLASASLWFARASLLFFVLSSAGPFSLGYIMATGLGQTQWYYFSVYYYLHFQYNGFFVLGVFSLFFQLIESKGVSPGISASIRMGRWLAYSAIPAYSLSVLWAKPGNLYNIVGAASAIAQIVALFMFLVILARYRSELVAGLRPISRFYLWLVLVAFASKLFLQMISAHPYITQLAWEFRPWVIAYLHLVLLGVVTLFLLIWYLENGLLNIAMASWGLALFLAGFLGSQICLMLIPYWDRQLAGNLTAQELIFIFSLAMLIAIALFLPAFSFRNENKRAPTVSGS